MFTSTWLMLLARRPSACRVFRFPTCKRYMAVNRKKFSYEAAIGALNSLQTNAQYMKNANRGIRKDDQNIRDTSLHLKMLGIEAEDIDSLNVIHVSGTKGKGSTCAFTESILHHHGIKTGFYSSPHLISVNERIRINGQPIEKDVFATYFWKVYETLHQILSRNEQVMPMYFQFLTVMAFYIFVKEKVEAAVIEVGIGGLYDCTNIVRNPVVVGVSTLGFDHMSLLGNTIELIAAQKAGIFKQNVPSFTVSQENDTALHVLQQRSNFIGCPLSVVPSLDGYEYHKSNLKLGIPGKVQSINASLAIQLSHTWFQRKGKRSDFLKNTISDTSNGIGTSVPIASPFPLSELDCQALESCVWLGRCQTLMKKNYTYFLDGAHTTQSMKHCVQWFAEASQNEQKILEGTVCKILLFNCTGNRSAECLLNIISEIHFDLALFSTNIISMDRSPNSDHTNFTVFPSTELETCKANKEIFSHMILSYLEEDCISIQAQTNSVSLASSDKYHRPNNALAFACISDVHQWLCTGKTNHNNTHFSEIASVDDYTNFHQLLKKFDHCQILVTGSINLVGNVLNVINDSEY